MFIEDVRGLLFIGDPHVSSKRIGRRKDDYLKSVLDKLRECAQLCHERKLVPVILGDLFHRNDDNNLSMLNALMRVLKGFPMRPLVLEGNHDKEQTTLSDADALTTLALANVVDVLSDSGEYRDFRLGSESVRLWAFPHGGEIPARVESFEGRALAVTHHDLAFGSAYPGSQPLKEIEGVELVVNGHMHDTKPAVQVGSTWWHNPGNIEPLSVDLAHHVPMAWEWTPSTTAGVLQGIPLTHGSDLFDLTGLQVDAADAADAVQAYVPSASEFAQLLQAQGALDAGRTDDASVLLEDLHLVLEASGASEASKSLLQALAAELVIEAVES